MKCRMGVMASSDTRRKLRRATPSCMAVARPWTLPVAECMGACKSSRTAQYLTLRFHPLTWCAIARVVVILFKYFLRRRRRAASCCLKHRTLNIFLLEWHTALLPFAFQAEHSSKGQSSPEPKVSLAASRCWPPGRLTCPGGAPRSTASKAPGLRQEHLQDASQGRRCWGGWQQHLHSRTEN